MVLVSLLLFVISFVVSNTFILFSYTLRKFNLIASHNSRKMFHITFGLSQMIFWPLYPDDLTSRFLGTFNCLIYSFIFFVMGEGYCNGSLYKVLKVVLCRQNDHKEFLYGPLNYCVTISVIALIFWRTYPPAIIGISLLLCGDGMAEVIGKSIGKVKLTTPWGRIKTLEGSLAVFIFGGIGALVMCYIIFHKFFFFYTTLLALVGMVVEFYSIPEYDNVLIPLSSLVFGVFLF
ncbi:hypothetical protein EIN_192850 [Entamoeba invadens IP1]|uniref:Phosphatidate cytidylyltransferase n=1 Tax=Entamoeba invadens IP1 TaxID=370355 RepID=A0A0A1U3G6_ENTIV|nr:hypothetical protein EIN_192850 [Entamoeba invadens IP1]ELP88676.1 hypothetical protein EIN_192850 [Entamoeba invadens IP1]|eukprot:XP_004255447.1 hypothetical protein EIN_192850 [Entamoeba invadens IP1]